MEEQSKPTIQEQKFRMALTAAGITTREAAQAVAAGLPAGRMSAGEGVFVVDDYLGRTWEVGECAGFANSAGDSGRKTADVAGETDGKSSGKADDAKGGTVAESGDSSGEAIKRNIGFTLTTPVLEYVDIDELLCLVADLRGAGAAGGEGCGVRLFLATEGWRAQAAQNLGNIVSSHIALLAHALQKPEWEKAAFTAGRQAGSAVLVPPQFNAVTAHTPATPQPDATTIEVFPSAVAINLDPAEIKACIQLALAIGAQAAGQRWASTEPVDTGGNEKYAFRTWLNRAGMAGAPYRDTRTLLLSRLEGDASYKGGRKSACG